MPLGFVILWQLFLHSYEAFRTDAADDLMRDKLATGFTSATSDIYYRRSHYFQAFTCFFKFFYYLQPTHIKNAPTHNITHSTIALETPLTGKILDPISTKPAPLIK